MLRDQLRKLKSRRFVRFRLHVYISTKFFIIFLSNFSLLLQLENVILINILCRFQIITNICQSLCFYIHLYKITVSYYINCKIIWENHFIYLFSTCITMFQCNIFLLEYFDFPRNILKTEWIIENILGYELKRGVDDFPEPARPKKFGPIDV